MDKHFQMENVSPPGTFGASELHGYHGDPNTGWGGLAFQALACLLVASGVVERARGTGQTGERGLYDTGARRYTGSCIDRSCASEEMPTRRDTCSTVSSRDE